MQSIVLGSSSPFRRQLLEKLLPQFGTCSPDIDETPLPAETPKDLVQRLALAKAEAVAKAHRNSLIIASDQVSVLDGKINGKPGNFENAFQQLKNSSGKQVTFFTSLCLYDATTARYQLDVELFQVHFRNLSDAQIERYLKKETPYNCAGSFKSEGFGIALFSRLAGRDPNTLIGLPLIRLVEMLETAGIQLP
ncbi:MAG TPA: nucleoside triphosphate pyrophosphatase [Dongiaceae bacterium]|nr:nucleoside triphosphate pyrophosphatase [Dongiaceae bacterium]